MDQRPAIKPAAAARKPWVKPAVQRIRAGDAEIGTRANRDGAFTTS